MDRACNQRLRSSWNPGVLLIHNDKSQRWRRPAALECANGIRPPTFAALTCYVLVDDWSFADCFAGLNATDFEEQRPRHSCTEGLELQAPWLNCILGMVHPEMHDFRMAEGHSNRSAPEVKFHIFPMRVSKHELANGDMLQVYEFRSSVPENEDEIGTGGRVGGSAGTGR